MWHKRSYFKNQVHTSVLLLALISRVRTDFFLASDYYQSEINCVTNTSSAMTWIYDIDDKEHKNHEEFIPKYNTDLYKCDIRKSNEGCALDWAKHPWTIKNSLQENFQEFILDRRWNDLHQFLTTYIEGGYNLRYTLASTNLMMNFELPISIRTDREAHIMLCDGQSTNPSTSSCYWFLLQAFSGNASAIRKCDTEKIPLQNRKYPKGDCSRRVAEINHPLVPNYLTAKHWSHFKLKKNGRKISIDNSKGELLKFIDNGAPINVSHLFIHSKMVNGLWRIMEYDFTHTTQVSSKVRLGPIFTVRNGTFCIAMFISMCSSCHLHLTLQDNFQQTEIFQQSFTTQISGWEEIKFVAGNISAYQVVLLISTEIQSSSSAPFWAVDSPRECHGLEEFRVLRFGQRSDQCQLLTQEETSVIFQGYEREAITTKCPTDSIGTFCLPCQLLYPDCSYITVCQIDGKSATSKCGCSAGFRGEYCKEMCSSPDYGQNCNSKCTNCNSNRWNSVCDNIHGYCNYGCLNGYTGRKCDIAPGFMFSSAPVLKTVSYTSCVVQVEDFKINDEHYTNKLYYNFQYREQDNLSWINTEEYLEFEQSVRQEITNLQPDTIYLIRAIISEQNQIYDMNLNIPFINCHTKCEEFKEENVIITPSNTTANVTVQKTINSCKIHSDNIRINKMRPILYDGLVAHFGGLTPFTDYFLLVISSAGDLKKQFRTLEGVPEEVVHFTVTNTTSTSINCQWDEPIVKNGIIRYYVIEYQLQRYLACEKPAMKNIKQITTENQWASITNLESHSLYRLNVYAETIFAGLPVTVDQHTQDSDDVVRDEIPEKFQLTEQSNSVDVQFDLVQCDLMRGQLLITINASCLDDWCNLTASGSTVYPTNLVVHMPKLYPYSNYLFQIKYSRNHSGGAMLTVEKSLRTKPDVPNKVEELLVYSKNTNSISLRWKAPYPPTGILTGYKVEVEYSQYSVVDVNQTCALWPELICFTLYNLSPYTLHAILVSARNQEPSEYGGAVKLYSRTTMEAPDAPYDLQISWTLDNKLHVAWKHPNITNGDLTNFTIILRPTRNGKGLIEEKLALTPAQFNLTYYHEIAADIKPATSYKIIVQAANSRHIGKQVFVKDTSPPERPKLIKEPDFLPTNTTITVKIPPINSTRNDINSTILLFGNYTSKHKPLEDGLNKTLKYLEINLGELEFLYQVNVTKNKEEISLVLGNSDDEVENTTDYRKIPALLQAGTCYNITIIVINTFNEKSRYTSYILYTKTTGEAPVNNNGGIIVLAVFFTVIILLAIFAFIKRKQVVSKFETWKKNYFKEDSDGAILSQPKESIALTNKNIDVELKKKLPVKIPSVVTTVTNNDSGSTYSKVIKISDFEQYVKDSIQTGELERQHSLFPRGQTKPWDYGALKVNKSKNRYNNLMAYDHTRVVLEKINGDQYSDYINANYIDGYRIPKGYIATQGPKATTSNDFWRMIWQENVRHIVMLANIIENGKKKVEKYWPDINQELQFAEITVLFISNTVYADYEHRVFNVTKNGQTRKVDQLHFSSWPDHGVPLYPQSVVPFLQEMLKLPLDPKSPILMHCSAGVGRTGTVILCDICLRMAAREGIIDVLKTLQTIRDQRANMVDNVEQYKLAHLVILECLMGMSTGIPCNEIEGTFPNLLKNGGIPIQMRYLKDTAWQDQVMNSVGLTENVPPVIPEKNRFKNIIPEPQGRVYLSTSSQNSSYINAVTVDNFRSRDKFIVTQQPLPNTVGDFWRLVKEHDVSVIISLNEIDARDKTSILFWPDENHLHLQPMDDIVVKHTKTVSFEQYNLTTVQLYSESEEHTVVEIISFKNWPYKLHLPPNIQDFLTFWQESDNLSRKSKQVIVTCHDGVRASGVYLALCFIIEKIKLEQICDVCQAVRSVRHNRSEFVREEMQFIFLYEAAIQYINTFQSYANFN